eukprot:gnl/Dysnectes_brevis/4421_a5936_674.p1 GENE.gnl/Dysnectes_brevis/4421_a5936_674~~gnl/Dysnectes_brevis/4421_a5936_674.p1  ORF type:complete len:210 (+),score=37.38 gnl/Dysnectes_brevis/4421_a5936_674:30-659(+)
MSRPSILHAPLNICVFGQPGSAKTTFISKLTNPSFDAHLLDDVPEETARLDFAAVKLHLKGEDQEIHLWDVDVSQFSNPTLIKAFTNRAHVILLTVNAGDDRSIATLPGFYRATKRRNHGVPVIILANRADLASADVKQRVRDIGLQLDATVLFSSPLHSPEELPDVLRAVAAEGLARGRPEFSVNVPSQFTIDLKAAEREEKRRSKCC